MSGMERFFVIYQPKNVFNVVYGLSEYHFCEYSLGVVVYFVLIQESKILWALLLVELDHFLCLLSMNMVRNYYCFDFVYPKIFLLTIKILNHKIFFEIFDIYF